MGTVRVIRKLRLLIDVVFTRPDSSPVQDGDVVTYVAAEDKFFIAEPTGGGGGGAPTNVNYLVGTASGSLSNEIAVGTTPGGELGGSWASPTVDTVHSGSSHAQAQAAAEATAAAALAGHEADTSNVHGIADTTVLATDAEVAAAVAASEAGQVRDGDAAGGVLGGTYPNPSFAVDMATQAELDANAAASVNDGDAAGGVLSGTYPNPGFAADMATQAELDAHINDASDAHDASAVSVLDTGGNFTGTDVEAVLAELQDNIDGVGGASGEAMRRTITQNAHGFDVGEIVRLDGTDVYALAQADVAANAEVMGMVAEVPDANTFVLHMGGWISGLTGLTAEAVYFLATSTPGAITATPPTTGISKPILVAADTDAGYFFNWRGITATPAGTNPSAYLRDEKANNTDGGTSVSGTWTPRVLNTKTDPDGLVTLNGPGFTSFTINAAGVYRIRTRCPVYSSGGSWHKAKLWDDTNSADAIMGSSAYCGADDQSDSWVQDEITLAGPTDFELQHRVTTGEATVGFGQASDFGVEEVFSEMWIEKVG